MQKFIDEAVKTSSINYVSSIYFVNTFRRYNNFVGKLRLKLRRLDNELRQRKTDSPITIRRSIFCVRYNSKELINNLGNLFV